MRPRVLKKKDTFIVETIISGKAVIRIDEGSINDSVEDIVIRSGLNKINEYRFYWLIGLFNDQKLSWPGIQFLCSVVIDINIIL